MSKFWRALDRVFGEMPQNEDHRDPASCEFKLKTGDICKRTHNVINVNGKMLCTHNDHYKRG